MTKVEPFMWLYILPITIYIRKINICVSWDWLKSSYKYNKAWRFLVQLMNDKGPKVQSLRPTGLLHLFTVSQRPVIIP